MASKTIAATRIRRLNARAPARNRYVLYWMQQSQRAECNHALEYGAQRANELKQPLVVVFGLMPSHSEANERHYRFMLEGLAETREALRKRGIGMAVVGGDPPEVALGLGRDASLVVCDRGYLRRQKQWRARVAAGAACEVVQVESDVVVPVDVASSKAEYAARTLRPKIARHRDDYLVDLKPTPLLRDSLGLRLDSFDLDDLDGVLASLDIDRSVPAVSAFFRGGTAQARARLRRFLQKKFAVYTDNRNKPGTDDISHLSPYLHFGQISAVQIALQAQAASEVSQEARDAFLEELIVRRELSMNYVNRTANYDSFEALPDWAKRTLREHRSDRRNPAYSAEELDGAQTHDPYWNAAMKEMKHTGFMHNYMRMYWGKKILEWSATPEGAFRTALRLNNRYFVDGRDANSYAGVGCVFGLHDRPWGKRPIFGSVRFMSIDGLRRKADPDRYVEKVERLTSSRQR
jgi:deoxyribodipyrimidine photo-lyase